MASRRAVGTQAVSEKADEPSHQSSSTSPAVPMHVIYKLLIATFLMVVAPLGVYFGTANTLFSGNTTWAGASAAVTANIVLIGYIVIAIREDQGEEPKKTGKIE